METDKYVNETVIRTLSEAFSNDALGKFVVPDDELRAQATYAFFSDIVEGEWSHVITRESGSAALVYREERRQETQSAEKSSEREAADGSTGLELLGKMLENIDREFQDLLAEKFATGVSNTKYLYLEHIGVSSDFSGRGLGKSMLREFSKKADGERLPIYFYTVDPKNVAYYLSLGYDLVRSSEEPISGTEVFFFERLPMREDFATSVAHILDRTDTRLPLPNTLDSWRRYDENPLNRVFFETEYRTVIAALDLAPNSDGTVRVLDVGTGTGRYAMLVKKCWAEAVGIDREEEMLKQARQKDPDGSYEFGDITEGLSENLGTFDRVNIAHVLKFINDADENVRKERLVRAFRSISRILGPDGILVFSEVSNATTEKTWEIVHGMETKYPGSQIGEGQQSPDTRESSTKDRPTKHSEALLRECLAESGFSVDIRHVYTDGVVRNPGEGPTEGAEPLIAVHTCRKIQDFLSVA